MNTLSKLTDLLTPPERRRAGMLLSLIALMALTNMLGVASILPFMAVLANPELLHNEGLLNSAFQYSRVLGIQTSQQFLLALGVLVFILLIASLALKALTTYAQTRFALMREYSIGKRLLEGYLCQPYSWFLNRNSADLGKNILSEVHTLIFQAMLPFMTLVAQSAVTFALLVLLILVDPWLALSVGFVLAVAYGGIFSVVNRRLKSLGRARTEVNLERFSAIQETFSAVKEVKVGGLEQSYIQRFSIPAEIYAKSQATAQAISQMPRFALEAIAFGGMLLLMLSLMTRNGSFAAALPIISLYAFAGYRLMPALQQIYSASTQLRFAGSALNALHTELMSLNVSGEPDPSHASRMPLDQAIVLSQIGYQYPKAINPTLKGIDLVIPAHSTVGFVGATGSGKTTIVDVILGLLVPQEGRLIVDGREISEQTRRDWQLGIGYVPQQIYLADESVAANIALGVPRNEIDQLAVERAARIANLHDFVTLDLPQGYNTAVGERGVRLSGGQRQRIGIARALYRNPQLLVMDEATSALDSLTEQAVMDAVNNLRNKITIILIAHRLSTVRQCDQIYLLDSGQLKAKGITCNSN